MELKKRLGKRIQELRLKNNLKQSELAEKVGIATKHQSCIETGKNYPSAELVENYARVFNIDVAEVLAIEVEDQPGGLEAALDLINEENINVEYIYAFVEKKTQKALVVLRTENNDKSQEILTSNGFSLLNQDEAYTL